MSAGELCLMQGEKRLQGGVFENAFSAEISSSLMWKNCSAVAGVAVLNLKNRMGL